MLLGKGPALEFLPVPPGDHLSAGRLDDPAHFPMFFHGVVIDDLPGLVLVSHDALSFLPVMPLGQLLNVHFQKSSLDHLFHAIPAEDIDRFSSPYTLPAAGANQLASTGPLRLLPAALGPALSGLAPSAPWRRPGPAAPADGNFRPALLYDVLQEFVPRLRDGPAVLFMMSDGQAPPLRFVPELPIMVRSAP